MRWLIVAAFLTALGACGAPPVLNVAAGVVEPPPSRGGSIASFAEAVRVNWSSQIRLRGLQPSAATLWMTVPNVCAYDDALFGFHGVIITDGGDRQRKYEEAVQYLANAYARRSPQLAAWYLATYGTSRNGVGDLRFTWYTRDLLNAIFDANIPRCEDMS
jgi:hypothetical protein